MIFALFTACLILVGQGAAVRALPEQAQKKPAELDQVVRLKSDLIEVRAVVTDQRGQLVGDLKKEDFEVLENDRPQEIVFFSVERIGGEARDRAVPEKKEAPSIPRARQPQPPARTIVLFVDTLHLSHSSLLRAKEALKKFVAEHVTDRDVMGVTTSGWGLGLLEQFTQNREILCRAIDKLTPWQGSRESLFMPYLAAMVAQGNEAALRVAMAIVRAEEYIDEPRILEAVTKARAREILAESAYRRRATLLTLDAVTERLATMPGQRLIIYVSDGFTMMDVGGSLDSSDLRSTISRAARSGVIIYSLSAKGLEVDPTFEPSRQFGGFATISGISASEVSHLISDSRHDLENGMNALASDTGGKAFFNTNDLSGTLQRALEGIRIYYALAYHPPRGREDKQFRRIIVRVRNHPEYVVRAQKGYLPLQLKKEEVAETPQQQLLKAITAPLPLTAIPAIASAEYFESDVDKAQVLLWVHIDGNALDYRQQEKRFQLELEVAALIYDMAGKPVKSFRDTVRGSLTPERLELAKQSGYRYTKRIALDPGLYQVRVGVREPSTNRIGTAMAWVEVPDLSKGKLTLSSLFLSENLPAGKEALQASVSLFHPTVTHAIKPYKSGDPLVYFLTIYNTSAEAGGESELMMRPEILQDGKPVYQGEWQPVALRKVYGDKKGIQVAEQLTLHHAQPGVYELRVTVKDPRSNKMVHRTVAFEVEP